MTWQQRTRDTIEFVSPLKKTFFAFWEEVTESLAHTLGIFKYPKIKGIVIQDLDDSGFLHNFSFSFHGENHDQQARAFFQACRETGTWEVTHPNNDKLDLQLSEITKRYRPNQDANATYFDSSWLEPAPPEQIISVEENIENLRAQSTIVNDTAAGQFDRFTDLSTASLQNATVVASRSLLEKIQSALASLYELNATLNGYINSVQRAVNNALNQAEIAVGTLANQFQQLIQLPLLATNNITNRLDSLKNLADSIFDLTPINSFAESRNTASVMDMGITAVLTAAGLSVIDADLETRKDALDAAAVISDLFIENTERLDQLQKLFTDQDARRQYFSQSESFPDTTILILRAIDIIIQQSFNLKIEKKFTLDFPRVPLEIAMTEYGGPGENDFNIHFFIQSNALSGNEIILLPAGREVTVYV
jgi:prophage DNA circulation protein